MRTITLMIFVLFCVNAFTQEIKEKEVLSDIKKVTVFVTGGQIVNEASLVLQQGQMKLKFVKLSPYIRKESIRIEGDGSYKILNVQHQNDYLTELQKNDEIEVLKSKIEELQFKIEDEETFTRIISEKLEFLKANKEINGTDKALDPELFNSLIAIYGNNYESLSLELHKKRRLIKEFQKEIDKINNQLNSLNSKTDLPSGTILVTIDSKQAKNAKIQLTYLVDHVGWYPSYDIRFMGFDKPLVVSFKANIRQNTGVDWNNVQVILSTAKTNLSAYLPELRPDYLQFHYPDFSQALAGRAPGVQITDSATELYEEIRIRGISTFNNAAPLYVVDGVPGKDISKINPDEVSGIKVLKDASATAIYGSRGANGVVLINTRKDKSSNPLVTTAKQETSEEYVIDAQQTILSNNKTCIIPFQEISLKTVFEYRSIPKLSANVFLIARIMDRNNTDLLDGEANLFLENSYVGKSVINTQQFNDTLDLSFGVDNNISIKREKLVEFNEKQVMGSNQKETYAYKITVKNNKAYPVTIKIEDQIPVSTTRDIQVDALELSGANINNDSGLIDWKLQLQPGEMKEIMIKYAVKYPKDELVRVE